MEEKNINEVKERKVKGKVIIDIERCKGCELCINTCKEGGLSLSETINLKGYRYVIANIDVCNGCVNCALVCPDAVITVYRTNPKKKKIDIPSEEVREQLKSIVTPAS